MRPFGASLKQALERSEEVAACDEELADLAPAERRRKCRLRQFRNGSGIGQESRPRGLSCNRKSKNGLISL
ncbi:hypothetical protein IE4872_PC00393 (plasmid) [Rhizobium gallicum]|uniref:Uncharacterized protein n=1 Tax=Rhizobium gallicum TaxID=56730 RepID=A0A1L5NR77_9HYPH|nr:hypothetical protein IE4872_PC00393 [Rhizobium gallicum]